MVFMAVVGLVAWAADAMLIFPSLGPSAYLLAYDNNFSYTARTVIGGHLCGVVGGLTSYILIVEPYVFTGMINAFSIDGAWLILGSVLALGITVLLMLLFQASHPPACATTLIISLGILPTLADSAVILLAVILLYLCYQVFQRFSKKTL